jgi:hypothetical protein
VNVADTLLPPNSVSLSALTPSSPPPVSLRALTPSSPLPVSQLATFGINVAKLAALGALQQLALNNPAAQARRAAPSLLLRPATPACFSLMVYCPGLFLRSCCCCCGPPPRPASPSWFITPASFSDLVSPVPHAPPPPPAPFLPSEAHRRCGWAAAASRDPGLWLIRATRLGGISGSSVRRGGFFCTEIGVKGGSVQ